MNTPEDREFENQMLEYRKKNFKVNTAPSRFHPGEICLSVTHNGYQWNTISLLPNEIDAVIAALEKHQQV